MSGKAPEPAATEPSQLDQVLAMLQGIVQRQDALESEIRSARASAPSFVPMRPAGRYTGAESAKVDARRDGDVHHRNRSKQLLMTTDGRRLSEMTLEEHPRRFDVGDAVRIDPESAREGFADGVVWGQILTEKVRSNPDGVGTIAGIKGLRRETREWHYLVEVPGLTGVMPDGFADRELLPA